MLPFTFLLAPFPYVERPSAPQKALPKKKNARHTMTVDGRPFAILLPRQTFGPGHRFHVL
jgi:hypothetical protein